MSESVWFEQVDEALIGYIQNIVKLSFDGEVQPVPVTVRKPDEDFKVEVYPSISIYNLYSELDLERMDNISSVISRDIPNKSMILEKSAVPYNLFYQVDFWAKFQEDMNDMTRLWVGNVGRDFNLPVKDMSGKDRSCYVLQTDMLIKSDFIDNTDRIYHSALTYRIYVEVDENVRVNVPLVIDTINNVFKTN